MYTIVELYRFFKIIESTQIKFFTEEDFVNKASNETLLRMVNSDNHLGCKKGALDKFRKIMKYYAEQSTLIMPLNKKLNDFADLGNKEFPRSSQKKREFKYKHVIKKDDPMPFSVEINTASKILAGLRSMIVSLHNIGKSGLENTVDMLDATIIINNHSREAIITSMIQFIEENEPKHG